MDDVVDEDGGEYEPQLKRSKSKQTGILNGDGSSCHQCKWCVHSGPRSRPGGPVARQIIVSHWLPCCPRSRKLKHELSTCDHRFVKKISAGDSRPCHKKYCNTCLVRFYSETLDSLPTPYTCASCRGICVCAACTRRPAPAVKGEKADELKDKTSASRNVAPAAEAPGRSAPQPGMRRACVRACVPGDVMCMCCGCRRSPLPPFTWIVDLVSCLQPGRR